MAAVIRELDEHTCDKGFDVRRSGLVRRVEVNADGSRISGSVSGTKRAPYSQSIMLNERNGRLRITGYCTCPMAFNCKHVAAVLIDLIEQRKEERDNPRPVTKESATTRSRGSPVALGQGAAGGRSCRRRARDPRTSAAAISSQPLPAPAVSSPAVSSPAVSSDVISWLDRLSAAAGPLPPVVLPAGRTAHVGAPAPLCAQSARAAGDAECRRDANSSPYRSNRARMARSSDIKPYDPENVTRPKEQRARFLQPVDELLLNDLLWLRRTGYVHTQNDIRLGHDGGSLRALESALSTGRLHYGSLDGPVLSAGPDMAAGVEWVKMADGRQRLAFVPAPSERLQGPADANAASQFDAVLRSVAAALCRSRPRDGRRPRHRVAARAGPGDRQSASGRPRPRLVSFVTSMQRKLAASAVPPAGEQAVAPRRSLGVAAARGARQRRGAHLCADAPARTLADPGRAQANPPLLHDARPAAAPVPAADRAVELQLWRRDRRQCVGAGHDRTSRRRAARTDAARSARRTRRRRAPP